ncbi:MAG: protein phosphatase CheZ [Magnetovibrio sp.]|nr:protein phosphatase CheZ [Magnetovibrio sp.]
MAGRKSKTAAASKPKANKGKAKGRSVVKSKALPPADANAVDHVVAAAAVTKGKKLSSKLKTSKAKTSKKGRSDALDVYVELEQLAAFIDAAKREIAEIRPQDVKDEHLPHATDQLDAVVGATADATNAIMDSCEIIEGVMGKVDGDVSSKLMDATTRIYEACSFQDITGQRINKVVEALKNIEERIDVMVETLGDNQPSMPKKDKDNKAKAVSSKPSQDEDLLEGPQLGDKAKSQSEIDDLLASFD